MATSAQDPAAYLFESVESHVAKMGRHLGDGAEEHLRQFIADGINRLDSDHGEVSPERVAQARTDLLELVDKAAEIAADLDNYAPDLLGERSYFPALGWFCPRYPFC